jgi:hypothetical protein
MDCADLEPIEEPLQKYWAGLAYKLARASEYLKIFGSFTLRTSGSPICSSNSDK